MWAKLSGWLSRSRGNDDPLTGQGTISRALSDYRPATSHWWYRLPATVITIVFAVAGARLPSNASGGLRAALAVGGVIGGAAIVTSVTVLVLVIIAPRRQRDEARAEIDRLRRAADAAEAAPDLDLTAAQVERLGEMIDDGSLLLQTADVADTAKWVRVTTEDLLDLTGRTAEANMFERAGIGARNTGGFISQQAAVESQINYLRDKVDPKLRDGYWPNSPFCDRQRELAHRPSDRDEEDFVIDRLRAGYTLRNQIRCVRPPGYDALETWVDSVVQGFRNRAQPTLGDRFVRRPDGPTADDVEPQDGWELRSAYLDRRLSALWAILRELRDRRRGDG